MAKEMTRVMATYIHTGGVEREEYRQNWDKERTRKMMIARKLSCELNDGLS